MALTEEPGDVFPGGEEYTEESEAFEAWKSHLIQKGDDPSQESVDGEARTFERLLKKLVSLSELMGSMEEDRARSCLGAGAASNPGSKGPYLTLESIAAVIARENRRM